MKVVIVSKALIVSTYRKKLAELARLGADVTAVIPPVWPEDGGKCHIEVGDDDGYRTILSPPRLNGHFHLHYYPDLPRILRDVRPDVVHIDEEPFNFATYHGTRAAKQLGIPSVFFSWQNLLRRYPPPFSVMERTVFRWTSVAIAGSEEAAGVLRTKGYAGKLAVIPQFGVDASVFSPGPVAPGPFRIGFLNRLIPAKAPLLALDAFERLPSDSRLFYVGDGPLRARLASEIARRGLGGRATLHARIPSADVPELLRGLHTVILPSLTTPRWKEQFGRILIEAMACGIPIVGSDSGQIPHVVGDAGLIVAEGDVTALAAALQRLHDDHVLRESLRERGRVRALENYTNIQVARETYDAYTLASD